MGASRFELPSNVFLARGGPTGRGGAIIKIQFAREISDGTLWNVW